MDDNKSGIGNFLGGIALGAVLGVVIGILFAPKSGEETREILKNKTGEFVQKVKRVPTDIKESLKAKTE